MSAVPSPDSRVASADLSRKRERFGLSLPFTGEVGNAPVFPGEGSAHRDYLIVFNRLKYFCQTLFPLVNSFLYGSDGPKRAHAPRFARHRGGAFARATESAGGRGVREKRKTDEQFCCRRQTRRRTPRQSQCATARPAFGGVSRASQGASRTAPGASPHARPRPCALPADARNRARSQRAACSGSFAL